MRTFMMRLFMILYGTVTAIALIGFGFNQLYFDRHKTLNTIKTNHNKQPTMTKFKIALEITIDDEETEVEMDIDVLEGLTRWAIEKKVSDQLGTTVYVDSISIVNED